MSDLATAYRALDAKYGKLDWRISYRNGLLYGSPWWSIYLFEPFGRNSRRGTWKIMDSTRARTLYEAASAFANGRNLESDLSQN